MRINNRKSFVGGFNDTYKKKSVVFSVQDVDMLKIKEIHEKIQNDKDKMRKSGYAIIALWIFAYLFGLLDYYNVFKMLTVASNSINKILNYGNIHINSILFAYLFEIILPLICKKIYKKEKYVEKHFMYFMVLKIVTYVIQYYKFIAYDSIFGKDIGIGLFVVKVLLDIFVVGGFCVFFMTLLYIFPKEYEFNKEKLKKIFKHKFIIFFGKIALIITIIYFPLMCVIFLFDTSIQFLLITLFHLFENIILIIL